MVQFSEATSAKRTAAKNLARNKKRDAQRKSDIEQALRRQQQSAALLTDIERELNDSGRFYIELDRINREGLAQTPFALAAAEAADLIPHDELRAYQKAWEKGDVIALAATVAANSPDLLTYTKEAIRYVTEPIAHLIGLTATDRHWKGSEEELYAFIAEMLKPTTDQIVSDILIRGARAAMQAWIGTEEDSFNGILNITTQYILDRVQTQAARNRGYYEQLALDNALSVLKNADHISTKWRAGVRILLSFFDETYFESSIVRDDFVSDIVTMVQEKAIPFPTREFTAFIAWDGAIDAFERMDSEGNLFGRAA
ncbi:conserved protein of unknown function [Pseudodesulfovibrio profundus]|uniref:Uncharacterized protein n=1 Tax=Pseudodesulfovibrio profundus TaxID=57320 RepID=A0A2C8FF35_9BACT|nr:hypothetical protein [Pseudodesulfovibrio profundus]SOB60508.1 conserved protein of unknown function [Pseudodesulfovibrio profundus]